MQLSSICNQKGLVMAGFLLAKEGFNFKAIIDNDLCSIFINELSPYAKFFGVTFKESNEHVKVSVLKLDNKDLLFVKNNYFGLSAKVTETKESLDNLIRVVDWNAANAILKNYNLSVGDIGKYRPLEIFYDHLRVSFDKGCYRGQEIVARMKYLGIDRRKFSTLISEESYEIDFRVKLISNKICYKGYKIFNCSVNRDDLELIKNNPLVKLIL
ncbi:MAG: folate-binding protein YgfZ [Gammaproteobacteria bacterium]|jgi:folate-binding protein YgfZ|tara:strand:- start:3746 stop:4384 length:639 start_codon:yes stop_codon:yes gene_type:complete